MNFTPAKFIVRALCTKQTPSNRFWFKIGDTASVSKAFSAADVQAFADLSGDTNPLHLDENYAKTTRYGRCIVHGVLVNGLISAVFGTKLPGRSVIFVSQNLKFTAPVFIGEKVTAKVEVTGMEKAMVTLSTTCTVPENQKVVATGSVKLYIPRPAADNTAS
ncbi:hydroxyacyl-thioester dehydratase type 2, mitochondrial-like [Saccoglossus kowalevskii]